MTDQFIHRFVMSAFFTAALAGALWEARDVQHAGVLNSSAVDRGLADIVDRFGSTDVRSVRAEEPRPRLVPAATAKSSAARDLRGLARWVEQKAEGRFNSSVDDPLPKLLGWSNGGDIPAFQVFRPMPDGSITWGCIVAPVRGETYVLVYRKHKNKDSNLWVYTLDGALKSMFHQVAPGRPVVIVASPSLDQKADGLGVLDAYIERVPGSAPGA